MPLFHFFLDETQGQLIQLGFHTDEVDPGGHQHPLGGHIAHGSGVLVREVDHFLDTALDDGLGTFVSGEQRHIDAAAPQVTAIGI